jgi:hypothetical protein
MNNAKGSLSPAPSEGGGDVRTSSPPTPLLKEEEMYVLTPDPSPKEEEMYVLTPDPSPEGEGSRTTPPLPWERGLGGEDCRIRFFIVNC